MPRPEGSVGDREGRGATKESAMVSRSSHPAEDRTRRLYVASMTEASMLRRFTDIEDKAGLGFVFHVRQARGQRLVGLTDVIAIVGETLGAFEIKTQRDRVSERQYAVLNALAAVRRVETGIVRPIPKDGEITLDEAIRRLGVDQ
jgi:hypothetical protein